MQHQARPAATILLLQEIDQGFAVFMQERHPASSAFGSMLVFPGGKVEAQDRDQAWRRLLPSEWADDAEDLAHRIAAIREAFEESGVLLARRVDSPGMVPAADVETLAHYRAALQSGQLTFLEFVRRHDLQPACEALVYYARWITPEFETRRFDTRFYLARLPAGQHALLDHDGVEAVDSLWIRPGVAVADARAGKRSLIFPTVRNLERLATFRNIDEALASCRACPVQAIQPNIDVNERGVFVRIPADAGYPVCEERLPDEVVKLLRRQD